MVEVTEAGIPIYAIYGSHDYTPTGTSVIDILSTAGALTNLSRWKIKASRLTLEVTEEEKTGAKLAGISARKIGLESKYYQMLDRRTLEELDGFKVFAFHSGISEFKPAHLRDMETLEISSFPKGFDYYAGGHIHQRGEFDAPGYEKVVFPGPLFTGYGKDIEDTARGEKRGFYVVEFDKKLRRTEFVHLQTFGGVYKEYEANGKNALQVNKEIRGELEETEVSDKVVVIRVHGELAGGRVADVDLAGLKARLVDRGALYVYLNRYSLTSRESSASLVVGADIGSVERRLFESEISKVKVSLLPLSGAAGASTAQELLRVLRQPSRPNEAKKDYRQRVVNDGVDTLQLTDTVKEGKG
jgi:DNA repair exonuclease SbcCD nuclease subunit